MLKILKTPEGKKFLIAVACVFIVAVCVSVKSRVPGRGRPVQSADGYLGHIPVYHSGRMGGHLQLYVPPLWGALPFRVLLSRP